jgi:hypothetical protein
MSTAFQKRLFAEFPKEDELIIIILLRQLHKTSRSYQGDILLAVLAAIDTPS